MKRENRAYITGSTLESPVALVLVESRGRANVSTVRVKPSMSARESLAPRETELLRLRRT